jgi:hypothetical protein
LQYLRLFLSIVSLFSPLSHVLASSTVHLLLSTFTPCFPRVFPRCRCVRESRTRTFAVNLVFTFTIGFSSMYICSKDTLTLISHNTKALQSRFHIHAIVSPWPVQRGSFRKYFQTHLPYLASILIFRMCHTWFFRCPLCGAPNERLDPVYGQACSFRMMNTRNLPFEYWITPTTFCGNDEFMGWRDAPRSCDRCANWEGQAIETMRRELEEQVEFERRFWDDIYRPN